LYNKHKAGCACNQELLNFTHFWVQCGVFLPKELRHIQGVNVPKLTL
jgi:hypothetical protein